MITQLSRLDYLRMFEPGLNLDTPDIVINEIILTEAISIEGKDKATLIAEINQKTALVLTSPITRQKWERVAHYVNPLVKWKIQNLRSALDFLEKLINLELTKLPTNLVAGLQTPDNIEVVNLTILYAFCLKYSLYTWSEMNAEQLLFAVRSLLVPATTLYSNMVNWINYSDVMSDLDDNSIVINCMFNLINSTAGKRKQLQLPPHYHQIKSSRSELEVAYTNLITRNSLYSRIAPTTVAEVIIAVALAYEINIASSSCPFDEYYTIIKSGRINYIPRDKTLAHYYSINPTLYRLEEDFSPFLPEECYTRNILNKLVELSGGAPSTETRYEYLTSRYYLNDFYHGIRPLINNSESPFDLDELDSIDPENVLCYGNPMDGFIFVTYTEMASFFRVNKAFLNPFDKTTPLSDETVAKLRLLAGRSYNNIAVPECRAQLTSTMIYVETFNCDLQNDLRNFVTEYEAESDNLKEAINDVLEDLFYLSMYMRGWEGEGHNYPITAAPYKNQPDVDLRVCNALTEFKTDLANLGIKWSDRIINLPLVKYEGTYVASIDEAFGTTIGEKLTLIEKGEAVNNAIATCIRVASAWLAATAYRYIVALGNTPLFDIAELIAIT